MADELNRGGAPETPMPLDDFEPFPPTWPKVVGGVSLALGSLGIICAVCGGAMMVAMPDMMKGNPAIDPNNLPPFMKPSPLMFVQLGLGVVLAILLLAAGGLTLGRQKLGRTLHLIWAPPSFLSGLFGIFLQLQQQAAMKSWAAANPDSPFSKNQSPIGMIIGIACGVILSLAWPTFCMVWFLVIKRTHAQMLHRSQP